ncbi:putative RING-H2 finger protein ATL53 [Mercurialis annua]|uniref:putative RING-H2 finger protein ATL53 n=1 Tax=Mercurialis annua TaxID=3986 RepID=UPI002160B042|nr:putative RING-H2 finger protein ATL53 [Mercurialis annua]
MVSVGTLKTWIPYENGRDCSKGFCSIYCRQWCYIFYPPPPPAFDEFPDDNSSAVSSPLVIAVIGILVTAFLLVSYYTVISKYCGNNSINSSRSRRENQEPVEELMEENHNPNLHEPWIVTSIGLDEALIKSITMCKFKKEEGLINGSSDCSVCLSEFQEDESIRLLPKCSHAFHVYCIDTWLTSHSNCPLCRANIVFPLLAPSTESLALNVAVTTQSAQNDEATRATTMPFRVVSDLRRLDERDTMAEPGIFPSPGFISISPVIPAARDERCDRHQFIRRSFSMDHTHTYSVADILRANENDEDCLSGYPASANHSLEVISKSRFGHRGKKVRMKRSFSSGRFFLARHGRVRNIISPV